MICPNETSGGLRTLRRQRGVALLIVLLLLVSVAGIAMTTTALMTRSIAAATASATRDVGYWALIGAERAALELVGSDTPLPASPVPITTPEGTVTVSLRPIACINVNSLVGGSEGEYETPKGESGELVGPGAARIRALVSALGGSGPAALPLMEAAADFMDGDQVPNTGGAEDFGYAKAAVPYRTAGQLMADISELRTVAGWDVATYRALEPYLCALPSTQPTKVDLAGLQPRDAPVLSAILDDALPMSEVERIIQNQPAGGYTEVSQFTSLPSIANLQPAPSGLNELDVEPTLLELSATASQGTGMLTIRSTLYRDGQKWQVLSRRFGA